MRVAIGAVLHEANTFSPRPTELDDFRTGYLLIGPDMIAELAGRPFEIGGACSVAAAEGVELVPTLACWAMPSGRVSAHAYCFLKDTLMQAMRAAGPVDGALLVLHGAMAVEGLDDAAGELLSAARAALGPAVPIVASLDLHANITRQMVSSADALVGYHTVPHVDHVDTGRRAAQLLIGLMRREVRSVMAWRKLPMITGAERHDTNRGPMKRLMDAVLDLEREQGILAAGLYPVQPWLDVAELGWTALVVADGDRSLAEEQAGRLARAAWQARQQFVADKLPVQAAIRRALEVEGGPVVLSDLGDVSSGGAPGDSAALLAALLEAGAPCAALLDIIDPPAVARAFAAGTGATLTLRLGGAIDPARQQSIDVSGRVARLSDGHFVVAGPSLRGYRASLGRTALVEVGPIAIVVHERGEMNIDPALYRSVGLEPLAAKIVQVKSPCGFRAAYEPIAAEIILVDSPGCTTTAFDALSFTRAPRPLFPLDEMKGIAL